MASYLEIQANKYAKKHKPNFLKKIRTFTNTTKELSQQECFKIYHEYKQNCIFTDLIRLSKLFENNNTQFNYIDEELNNVIDKNVFVNLYRNYIGNIYNKLFKKLFEKLSLVEKIENANEQISRLYECITGRIMYHNNCIKYTQNYNVDTHEFEILVSIYMYNRIKEIQKLLNKFKVKHNLFKQKTLEKLIRVQKEYNDFEELSADSSTLLSEPFIENISIKRQHN